MAKIQNWGKISKTGKGKYDREHQLGKIKNKNPGKSLADSAKRCKAQGKQYLSLKTGLIRGSNPVIIGMRLHSNSSNFKMHNYY